MSDSESGPEPEQAQRVVPSQNKQREKKRYYSKQMPRNCITLEDLEQPGSSESKQSSNPNEGVKDRTFGQGIYRKSMKPLPRRNILPGGEGVRKVLNLMGDEVFLCVAEVGCTYQSKHYDHARDHVNSKHFKKFIRCNKCPNAYLRFTALKEHFVKKHKINSYQCTFENCTFKSCVSDVIVDHYKSRHNSTEIPEEYLPLDPSIPPVLCGKVDGDWQQPPKRKKPSKKKSSGEEPVAQKKQRQQIDVNEEQAPVGLQRQAAAAATTMAREIAGQNIMSYALVHKDRQGRLIKYSCKTCGGEFVRLKAFHDHYMQMHANQYQQQGVGQTCLLCGFVAYCPSSLTTHFINVHKAKAGKSPTKRKSKQ